MRYTYKNKVREEGGVPQAVFDMWQVQSSFLTKKRKDMGEVTLDSTQLKMYCDSFAQGRNIGGGYYSPEAEDHEEFKKALKAVDYAWKARGR